MVTEPKVMTINNTTINYKYVDRLDNNRIRILESRQKRVIQSFKDVFLER